MKYLITIYGNDEVWSSLGDAERDELIKATDAHNGQLFASGELLGAYGVADQAAAKRVHLDGGVPVVSDGPYIETKEYVGSFYVVDCQDEARALEIAGNMPSAAFREIEVRAILHGGSADDF